MPTFNRFGPLSIVNYVSSTSERTDWYRAIMRTFFRFSHEYHYRLTAQEIMDAVCIETMQEYTIDVCKRDLESLVAWGNLTVLPDMSRVTTIADFRSPILLYQATSDALEFEAFIEKHLHIGASEGGLHQGDLLHLLELLRRIDHWLQGDQSTFTEERCQEIASAWKLAFDTWERVTNDAAQYLGSMNQNAQYTSDLPSYLAYKNVVITYIQNFADTLSHYSQTLRQLFLDWSTTGKAARLLQIITSTTPLLPILADQRTSWDEDIQRQIRALQDWFLQERNAALFSQAAHDAIGKVVLRASALASSMRPQTDFVSLLSAFATMLFQIEDPETARLLFATAFACATPTHLPESVTGSPEAAGILEQRISWENPPTVVRELRPIYKGNAERSTEKPMRHNPDAVYEIKKQHDEQVSRQQGQLSHLFQVSLLDLANLRTIAPDERLLLSSIIDGCLGSPVYEYTLSDGALVTLLNPEERDYIALSASDGVLLLPRYRLQHRSASSSR
ncbi:MAG: DUF2397 domain-containing protein [Ktedonobacteraceae bacterium]|nr:DUF2397 domain-containing protein [Ktedonobacteraceae bacterium]